MKKDNGIVLDNPGKPDYHTHTAFRIIVLLETVTKILERLAALRLTSAALSLGLLHPNQCGFLAGLDCFDTVATLTHEVRLLQPPSCKVSTLFLDVKGGFHNVCTNKLADILTRGGVSAYLVGWIKSFLSKRQCRLIFQGAPKVFCPVAVGTPRCSPIFSSSFCALYSQPPPDYPPRSGDFICRRPRHHDRLRLSTFEDPRSSILFRYHPKARCRPGGRFFCLQN